MLNLSKLIRGRVRNLKELELNLLTIKIKEPKDHVCIANVLGIKCNYQCDKIHKLQIIIHKIVRVDAEYSM